MNFRITKLQVITGSLLLCLLFTSSCNYNSKQTISQASHQLCDCFSKQKGRNIDAKMSPCVNDIANVYGHSKHTFNIASGADSLVIKAKMDSVKAEDLRFISVITNNAVISCDALGSEVEAMYDKRYPIDSSTASLSAIHHISTKLNQQPVADTVYKELLHELTAQNIKARQLESALQNCKKNEKTFP